MSAAKYFAFIAALFFVLLGSSVVVQGRYLIIPRYRRSGFSDQARAALETLIMLRKQDHDRSSIITYDPSKRTSDTSSHFDDKNFLDFLESAAS